jgi:hypothetical protein
VLAVSLLLPALQLPHMGLGLWGDTDVFPVKSQSLKFLLQIPTEM